MGRVEQIAASPRLQHAWQSVAERHDEFIDWIVAVQQIPAPTFSEEKRAQFVAKRFRQLGLEDVRCDEMSNVYGRLSGANKSHRRPVVISAHSDTVFPMDTDLRTRREHDRLYGPGVGDNSAGVAGLLAVADTLIRYGLQPSSDIWFVSNVGEEGMGDLCGMREVVRQFGHHAQYVVVEGGLYGQIAHEAIGVRRFRIEVEVPGGHSWGSFGSPNAIHELAHIVTAIDRLSVGQKPKSTYNVGVFEGGTTINSIASRASMLLDLRSESAADLGALVSHVNDIVHRAQLRARRGRKQISYSMEKVGDRPAGRIPRATPLVRWAEDSLKKAGCPSVLYVAGSTDANVPLSMGIPAVCIGLTESANSHRLDEHITTELLPAGLRQLLLLALAAGDFRPES